jgi:hypothetical protein
MTRIESCTLHCSVDYKYLPNVLLFSQIPYYPYQQVYCYWSNHTACLNFFLFCCKYIKQKVIKIDRTVKMKYVIYDELFWRKLVKILCELYYCTPDKGNSHQIWQKISCTSLKHNMGLCRDRYSHPSHINFLKNT